MRYIFFVIVALGIVAYAVSMKGQPSAGSSLANATSGNYRDLAAGFAHKYQISEWVFLRQVNQESGWNPSAVSPAGAEGLCQFMPDTAQAMGVDPWNVSSCLDGMGRLDRSLLIRYGGSWALALAAYNAGGPTTNNALARCGSAWRSCLPGQTQRYIRAILGG